MVAIGLLLVVGALGAAAVLVMQNRGGSAVHVQAFAHTLALQPYSILAAGAAMAVIALIGVAVMRRGAARARRRRHQRVELLAEYAGLSGRGAGAESSFFFDAFADDQGGGPAPARPSPRNK